MLHLFACFRVFHRAKGIKTQMCATQTRSVSLRQDGKLQQSKTNLLREPVEGYTEKMCSS